MSNALTANPFGAQSNNAQLGAFGQAESSKAMAEIQAAMMIARINPRDPIAATDRILNACCRPTLAASALYSYAKGGSDITGPSIRLAECAAQEWGNIHFGFKEVSRGRDADGVNYSEIEAFAWDMERGTKRPIQFRVRHWRDTKKGGYQITDERDIYELTANMAQRRVRACILAIIPGDVIEAAVNQCEVTMSANADITQEGTQKLVDAFSALGVTKAQIEKRIQRRMDAIQPAHVVGLKKIYRSLKDEMSSIADWFEVAATAQETDKDTEEYTKHEKASMQVFQAAAALGVKSLNAALAKADKNANHSKFWARHSVSLKAVASAADEAKAMPVEVKQEPAKAAEPAILDDEFVKDMGE